MCTRKARTLADFEFGRQLKRLIPIDREQNCFLSKGNNFE